MTWKPESFERAKIAFARSGMDEVCKKERLGKIFRPVNKSPMARPRTNGRQSGVDIAGCKLQCTSDSCGDPWVKMHSIRNTSVSPRTFLEDRPHFVSLYQKAKIIHAADEKFRKTWDSLTR
ncbi:hypothetical protein P5V15_000949 [Pogonomyrmex californicus]